MFAVLDNLMSEMCQELNGKVVDLKEAKPGVTTAGHIMVILLTEFDVEDSTCAANDPLTGEIVQVHGSLV